MKIVIDIPQIMYGDIKLSGITFLSRDDKKTLRKSIANGTPLKEWLESFNTDSASVCFNKIQELKGIVGAGSEKNTQGVYDGHITS